eukprot:366247-Chlamydomonas_euryale.AAC.10
MRGDVRGGAQLPVATCPHRGETSSSRVRLSRARLGPTPRARKWPRLPCSQAKMEVRSADAAPAFKA